jgi:hypothetical protein
MSFAVVAFVVALAGCNHIPTNLLLQDKKTKQLQLRKWQWKIRIRIHHHPSSHCSKSRLSN